MLGYQLRYRKGSFDFTESFLSKTGAILRGAALMADGAIYDLAIFGADGHLVASESEIAWLSGGGTRHALASRAVQAIKPPGTRFPVR